MGKLGAAVPLAAIGFALAACASAGVKHTPTTTASSSQTAAPPANVSATPRAVRVLPAPRVDMAALRGHGAAFISPTRLAFLTSGSSNCRAVPATLAVETSDSIRIQLREKMPRNGICLQNLVIEPVVIAIDPKQIDAHHRLEVNLYYPKGVTPNGRPVVFTAPPL